MKSLPRFAPLITILALLVLVAIGGSALANNRATPNVESEPATVRQRSTPTTSAYEPPATEAPEEPTTQIQESPVQPPVPAPAQITQAPQVPLNYQYYDDDWDDDDDDDFDDDWDDDDDDD